MAVSPVDMRVLRAASYRCQLASSSGRVCHAKASQTATVRQGDMLVIKAVCSAHAAELVRS